MPMKEGGALAPLEVVETWLSLTVSDLVCYLARQEYQQHPLNYLSCWNQQMHSNAPPSKAVIVTYSPRLRARQST